MFQQYLQRIKTKTYIVCEQDFKGHANRLYHQMDTRQSESMAMSRTAHCHIKQEVSSSYFDILFSVNVCSFKFTRYMANCNCIQESLVYQKSL